MIRRKIEIISNKTVYSFYTITAEINWVKQNIMVPSTKTARDYTLDGPADERTWPVLQLEDGVKRGI